MNRNAPARAGLPVTWRLHGTLVVPLLLSAASLHAQQLAPNPNPAGNTITVGAPGAFNGALSYVNSGTIDITSAGVLTNQVLATLATKGVGQIQNAGQLINNRSLFFENSAQFTNSAQMLNGNPAEFGYFLFLDSATGNNTSSGTITNDNNASIDIYDNSVFTNQGLIDNYGTMFLLEDVATPTFNNAGTLWNHSTGPGVTSLFSNDGVVNNSGTLRVDPDSEFESTGTLDNLAGGSFLNEGLMTNTRYPGTTAQILNAGTFTVTSSGSVDRATPIHPYGDFRQTAGSTTIDGSFIGRDFDVDAGTLTGSGSVNAQLTMALGNGAGAAATLDPGGTADRQLDMVGRLAMATDGVLNIDIASLSLFDKLALSGAGSGIIDLGGSLLVQLEGGYTPALGDTFTFLTANDINGSFASLLFPTFAGGTRTFALSFNAPLNPTAASLTTVAASPVPLPGAGLLLPPAVLLLTFLRRRAVALTV